METFREIVGAIFLLLGSFFALTGAVGVIRMPDFFTRIHPAGKSDTLAQSLVLLGLLVYPVVYSYDDPLVPVKLVMITVLLYVTAPTATHAITRAADHSERRPGSGSEESPDD